MTNKEQMQLFHYLCQRLGHTAVALLTMTNFREHGIDANYHLESAIEILENALKLIEEKDK